MEKQIAIIGAGISGLLACKHAVDMGFSPTVFEARDAIGGVWAAQSMESTKLQTPKTYYQFSDFAWPPSVNQTFPHHTQVFHYIQSYARHFDILRLIKFNSRVIGIDYSTPSDEEGIVSGDLWGGYGGPFSATGKWKVAVQDTQQPLVAPQVYQVDFVILCIGKFSDLPNVPDFPISSGPRVFDGEVIHSMDYAAMGYNRAAELITGKRITVVGFQKSAVDVATEVANKNGARHPCTLLFKTVHWTVPENLLTINFRNLNRFSEFMIHKPDEGFFLWFLALLLSPLLWIFSKLVESYLKWIYPLKKYNMVPDHAFFKQISSCMFTVLPAKFYNRVEEGSIILKKTQRFGFCKNGLIIDGEPKPLATDIVIFATGYRGEEKLKNIFTSTYFQKCVTGSSAPLYRECIHPRIPQLAILGYSESPTILYTTEMRSKWLAHFLAGKFELPTVREMEDDVQKWEKCMRRYACDSYKWSCVSVLLQIYCNDQLCRDIGRNPRRKKSFLSELFAPYGPTDYADLTRSA
ncbi:probable flavin-containing monooxygenase 1 [Cornus florida]|uniref:probable flavin-containing monooxygenase 1 n=1 Tax=Cornus florida TaxID=4283 RepID=UPI0028982152|nr:probable flavin-containing monooxygenase 1 [Cornus florida]